MSFLNLVRRRRSVRRFTASPVPREALERCIEASRLAPSACNSQPWTFVVVDEPSLRDQVAKATFSQVVAFNRFVLGSRALVVVVAEPSSVSAQIGAVLKNIPYNLIDVGIAAEHFCLQAVEEGLGTCMLGWFDEKSVKKLLGIPSGKKIGLIIAVGYPETEPAPAEEKRRKPIGKVLCFNRYPS